MKLQGTTKGLWPGRALITLFGVVLALPLMDMVYPINPITAPLENRPLADYPDPPKDFRGLGKYFSGWEAYFNDHFGWRETLVMWHDEINLGLFKENSHNVMVGTDGWLFYAPTGMIENFRADSQFTEAELRDWQNLVEHRRDWLAQRGIKYLFVLAPDKQSVEQEYLPAWLKQTGRPTKADQFIDFMKAHSTVEILDLRPALFEAKKSAPVYQQTDTHWNEFGAFVAYKSLVDRLSSLWFPGLKPVALDYFKRTDKLHSGGDMAYTIGVSMVDSNVVTLRLKPGEPTLQISKGDFAIGGKTSTRQPGGHGSAIVFHDSFGYFWVPYLGYQFSETDYVWEPHMDVEMIRQKRPDVVINEMLERLFYAAAPKQLSTEDGLP